MLSQLDEIKNKLDIVEVIGQYIKLQKAGTSYRAVCPFHKEKTPSFMVSPARQIWHCFGCGLGGDAFGFVMKMENIDFPSALKMLANKAGVKLISESPQLRSEKNLLNTIVEDSVKYFQDNLRQTPEVLNYLHQRGLKDETIKEFELGFAADEWSNLTNYLIKKNYKPKDIERTGLVINKNQPEDINQNTQTSVSSNDIYDRFRSRIMFPIKDISSTTIGFTGRIYTRSAPLKTVKNIDEVGKYINTPQTLLFDKGKILYGLDKTKNDLRLNAESVIVEGQMDFLAAYQNGIKNIVASSGTALTPYQLAILKRYNNKLVLAYDMDEAGQIATERGISLALNNGFDIKILNLPKSKDIADYVLEEPKKLKDLIKDAEPIMDFYFRRVQSVADSSTLEGKKQMTSYLLPKIKNLANAIDRSVWLEKLSSLVSVPIKVLEDEIPKIKLEPNISINEAEELTPASSDNIYKFESSGLLDRRQVLNERITAIMLKRPALINMAGPYKEYFVSPYSLIAMLLEKDSKTVLDKNKIKGLDLSEEITKTIDYLFLKGEYELDLLSDLEIDVETEMEKNLKELKSEYIKYELQLLNRQIKDKELGKDKGEIKELLDKFNDLTKQLYLNQ